MQVLNGHLLCRNIWKKILVAICHFVAAVAAAPHQHRRGK